MLPVRLPEGYIDLDRGRWRVIAARLELAEMVALLETARSGTLAGDAVGSGRGGTVRVTLRGGKIVYVRHYLRGGAMRHVVRDLYLLRPPRPIRELMATEQARAAGCRVPIVNAVAIEETGPFYRGWIVTSAIEGARGFFDVMARADAAARGELLLQAGSTIRALNHAGVYHADLTGHNLLVDAGGRVSVIDFDRAVLAAPDNDRLGQQGLDRFWRSLTKLARQHEIGLQVSDKRWIERGYAR